MAHLTYLPPELHCAIASLLRPRDIVNLRASCKKLRVLLAEHENHIVQAIITYRYSFLVMKVPLPQERSSIDPEVHEAMKTSTLSYRTRDYRPGFLYPAAKLDYPRRFCQCSSCVYAWELIWVKVYEALWCDWAGGLEKRSRGERQANFIATRIQAFVMEITKSKLAYAYLLDFLLEGLAIYMKRKSVKALEGAPVSPPVEALCQPTECHIPNLEPDPEFDCWLRTHVNQDNSDRAAREHERDAFRGSPGFVNSISGEFVFLSDKLEANKSLDVGLGHSILKYLAEMRVMIERGEDTIVHEAPVQVHFGAEATRHNVVFVWRRKERHLQVIQLRKEVSEEKMSGCIALPVSSGKSYFRVDGLGF